MRRDYSEACELAAVAQLPATPKVVVEALAPLLTAARIARIDAGIARRTRCVVPVLDAVDDPRNVAAVMRSADAFGIQEIHVIEGSQPFVASPRITQGAEHWLDIVRHDGPEACIAALRARSFKVYVATMDGDVVPEDLARQSKLAIVFGNEQAGVRDAILSLSDGRYTIPMTGFAQSLNVSVAAAITFYSAMRGRKGDLSPGEQDELRARFMLRSIPRAEQIVLEYVSRRPR